MVDRSSPATRETIIGAGLDTWSGSPFVQARLALLGKTVSLLSFGFFAAMNCVVIAGAAQPEEKQLLMGHSRSR